MAYCCLKEINQSVVQLHSKLLTTKFIQKSPSKHAYQMFEKETFWCTPKCMQKAQRNCYRNWSWKKWKKIEKKYFFVSFKFFSFLYFISKKIYTFVIEFFLLWMNTWNYGNFINWKRDARSRKTLKNLKTKNTSFMKSAAKKQQNNFFHFKTF